MSAIFTISTESDVSRTASRKLAAVFNPSFFVNFATSGWDAVRAAIKIISGSRKASKTLRATGGPFALPNC